MNPMYDIFENQKITDKTFELLQCTYAHSHVPKTSPKILLAINCDLEIKNNPRYTKISENAPGIEFGSYGSYNIVSITGVRFGSAHFLSLLKGESMLTGASSDG